MFAVKAKIYGSPAVLLLMKHLIIGPNFSALHWSPHSSLVSIGQHFVTMRLVHLPKRTDKSLMFSCLLLISGADLIIESDQAVRAVYSCTSWFVHVFCLIRLNFCHSFLRTCAS